MEKVEREVPNQKNGLAENRVVQEGSVNTSAVAPSTEQSKPVEPKPIPTYILLIRHGENDWVSKNRLAGRTPDVHLNEKGQQQAIDVAKFLENQPIQAIYSSPLERCLETAQPLADILKLPIQIEPGVIEVDYGEWRGAELKELAQHPAWRLVQHYPSIFRFPQGETLYEVQARAAYTIEQLRNRHAGQVIAVFSHADVIRLLVAHYIGTPIDLFQRVQISTASISVLFFQDQVPFVINMNQTPALPIFKTNQGDSGSTVKQ